MRWPKVRWGYTGAYMKGLDEHKEVVLCGAAAYSVVMKNKVLPFLGRLIKIRWKKDEDSDDK